EIVSASATNFPLAYRSRLEIYTAELQHFWDWGDHRTILGGRYQTGEFDTHNATPTQRLTRLIKLSPTDDRFETDFERVSLYAYHHWQPVDRLRLIGGLSYDQVRYPENFRHPPIDDAQASTKRLSPKAGLIWSPASNTTLRAAYTRSLGGVSIDQSFQLEPPHVAGFAQTFRSLIPDSAAGAVPAARHETFGLALDQKFPTRTYLGISGEWLESEGTRQRGVFRIPPSFPLIGAPSVTPESLNFRERTVQVNLNQLVGEEWAFGASYRVSLAELDDAFREVPMTDLIFGGFTPRTKLEATLHQVHLLASWASPSGFFARFDSIFSAQHNRKDAAALVDDAFWQFNVFAGYRFLRRRMEVTAGLLNLTDRDYRLNPLNLTPELPRKRTVALRIRLTF
ncbi:MAG TPA: TonB-dependent receptor, partial [Bryobacteraceae bacterium]|nr:TonB-dependent receptor [Bryobacteraceae bacterium]